MSRSTTPRPSTPLLGPRRPGTPADYGDVRRLLASRPSSPLPARDADKSTFHETKHDLQSVLLSYIRSLPPCPNLGHR
jgi:hypothetical protein